VKRAMRAFLRVAMFVAVCVFSTTAQKGLQQYDAKAKFLATTARFVEWPASSFKTPSAPLQICIQGNFSFGTRLAELTRSATVDGHRVEVKWIRKEQDLPGCQLIFLSRSEAKRYDKVLEAVKTSIALTVGEDEDFLHAGGMLSLETTRSGVLFDVNLDAVNEGHLKLSSQLLSLARHVLHRTELAGKLT
jgi:YfiR/HmsC-like